MLTAEQLEERQSRIGSSEVSALVGANPWATSLDTWCRKRRGADLELPPIVKDAEPDPDKCAHFTFIVDTDVRTAGSILEDGLASLYEHRTGVSTVKHAARTRPEAPWQAGNPDRLILNEDGTVERGIEIKLVSRHMRHHWPSDGAPSYTLAQTQWLMHIFDAEIWDVAALVDGTDFRIIRVERDEEVIEGLVEVATTFWHDHVLADVMPSAEGLDDVRRYMQARWKQDNGETLAAPAHAETIAREIVIHRDLERHHKDRHKKLGAMLTAMCGEHKAIEGPWGSWRFPTQQGNPKWKAIAEDLAGGVVPAALIEKHRGDSFRKTGFSPYRHWQKRILEEEADNE